MVVLLGMMFKKQDGNSVRKDQEKSSEYLMRSNAPLHSLHALLNKQKGRLSRKGLRLEAAAKTAATMQPYDPAAWQLSGDE